MVRVPKISPVEFLVARKFPNALKLPLPIRISLFTNGSSTTNHEHQEKRLKEIEEYEAELRALPDNELLSLFKTEQEKYQQEQKLISELNEQKRFFNLPSADADFDHWSKAAYWSIEEAVALSFGKDPGQVNWNKLKNYSSITSSPLIEKYQKFRDLALRAKHFGQLYDPCLPSLFLAWARRMGIDMPTELIEKIEAQGTVIADWKDLYDKLKEQYESLETTHKSIAEELVQFKNSGKNQPSVIDSEYWRTLEQLAEKAISEFPEWKKTQRQVQKTGNLMDWLTNLIGADNREAEILKKTLSDIFEELQ